MKLTCEFILREVAGESILVPVGSTALAFNGIITLDPVGTQIWKDLEAGKSRDEILNHILEDFDVTAEIASHDLDAFLNQLREKGYLE